MDGKQVFTETDLRERVYQKHPDQEDGLVCYCFRHTLREVLADGAAIADSIRAGIQDQKCACDIRNPQGSCCLGNIQRVIKRARAAPAS